jgi:hypothetical protein
MRRTELAELAEHFDNVCCIKNCASKVFAVGLCNAHWTRNRRYGSPILLRRPQQYTQRLPHITAFNQRIRKSSNGCWVWIGHKDARGYGRFARNLHGIHHIKAHRWSWAYHNGKPIPDGMVVMHSCDLPACVNPEHLVIGTQAENIGDMYRKGRGYNLGRTAHGRAKLTEADVAAIRKSSLTQDELAALYGIGQSQVSRIVRGESWQDK